MQRLSVKVGFAILIISYLASFIISYLLIPAGSYTLEEYLISPAFIAVQGTFSVSMLLLTLLLSRIQGFKIREFGFDWGIRRIALGAALGFGMFLLERTGYHLLQDYIGESQLQRALIEAARSEQGLVVMLLVGAVLAPVSEEVYFRGYMLTAISDKLGVKAGILLSSAYFAAVHFDMKAFIPIFFLGTILAYVYARTSSIAIVIVAHTVINSTTFLLSYLGMEV